MIRILPISVNETSTSDNSIIAKKHHNMQVSVRLRFSQYIKEELKWILQHYLWD